MRNKALKFGIPVLGCIVILLIGYYSIACLSSYILSTGALNSSSHSAQLCLGPPQSFSASDLVGTWMSSGHEDTLIIREDGMYKQIIHVDHIELPDIDYESDWQTWRLVYSDEGVPYVYLKGLNLCAAYPDLEDCEHPNGKESFWADTCSPSYGGEKARLDDEGGLIVMGSPAPSQPRGIQLFIMSSSEFARGYELEQP